MKRILPTVVFAVWATAFAISPVMATDEAGYQAALEQARQTLADAQEKTQLWTTSELLLEEAAAAAAAGDFELAIEKVNEARLHAELAVATAEREKKVWHKGVPE